MIKSTLKVAGEAVSNVDYDLVCQTSHLENALHKAFDALVE